MSAKVSRWSRKKAPAQIELTGGAKREKYDAWAALAEALLVFMVSFGAVGGFLNAYRLEYNQLLCLFGTLGFLYCSRSSTRREENGLPTFA